MPTSDRLGCVESDVNPPLNSIDRGARAGRRKNRTTYSPESVPSESTLSESCGSGDGGAARAPWHHIVPVIETPAETLGKAQRANSKPSSMLQATGQRLPNRHAPTCPRWLNSAQEPERDRVLERLTQKRGPRPFQSTPAVRSRVSRSACQVRGVTRRPNQYLHRALDRS